MRYLFLALFILTNTCYAAKHQLDCVPTKAQKCSFEGCVELDPSVSVSIRFPALEYLRCDIKGCDTYNMKSQVSGVFTNVTLEGKSSTFLRYAGGDGRRLIPYVEVLSLGFDIYHNYGACTWNDG